MLTLRSTLFLACLTAILHGEHYLDWMDALALQLVPAHAFERELKRDSSFRTLVLTLTPEFFEAEFGGHTPINRHCFQDLIKAVVVAYPRARVVAIDYDFSERRGAVCGAGRKLGARDCRHRG